MCPEAAFWCPKNSFLQHTTFNVKERESLHKLKNWCVFSLYQLHSSIRKKKKKWNGLPEYSLSIAGSAHIKLKAINDACLGLIYDAPIVYHAQVDPCHECVVVPLHACTYSKQHQQSPPPKSDSEEAKRRKRERSRLFCRTHLRSNEGECGMTTPSSERNILSSILLNSKA